jgi:hypothetical protein
VAQWKSAAGTAGLYRWYSGTLPLCTTGLCRSLWQDFKVDVSTILAETVCINGKTIFDYDKTDGRPVLQLDLAE